MRPPSPACSSSRHLGPRCCLPPPLKVRPSRSIVRHPHTASRHPALDEMLFGLSQGNLLRGEVHWPGLEAPCQEARPLSWLRGTLPGGEALSPRSRGTLPQGIPPPPSHEMISCLASRCPAPNRPQDTLPDLWTPSLRRPSTLPALEALCL